MANNYYNFSPSFVPGTKVRSDEVNTQYAAIEAGFDFLPANASAIILGTTYLGTETGSANQYDVALPNTRATNAAGDRVVFKSTHANTGATTIKIDALSVVALVGPDGVALVSGDIANGLYYEAVFDLSNNRYQLLVPTTSYITNAALEVTYSKQWATQVEDTPVTAAAGGDGSTTFSALHWAAKASASASAASSSAGTASSSASAASTSADEAAASAASNNLPTLVSGDEGKRLQVNAAFDGYDLYTDGVSLLTNGDFTVWQRNVTFAGIGLTLTGDYAADMWRHLASGPGVLTSAYTIARSVNGPTDFQGHSLQVDVTTADVSLLSSDEYALSAPIEGVDIAELKWGSSAAEDITISFWASSPKTGDHTVVVQNAARNRSYISVFSPAVADTWEKFKMTVPGDTSGTWDTGSGDLGLQIIIPLAAGGAGSTPDTWINANSTSVSGQVNILDNVANNFYLKEVKVERGGVATPFQHKTFAEDVAACKRYYEKSYDYDKYAGALATYGGIMHRPGTMTSATHTLGGAVRFAVDKPANNGTLVGYAATSGTVNKFRDAVAAADINVTFGSVGASGFDWTATLGSATTVPEVFGHWTAEYKLT